MVKTNDTWGARKCVVFFNLDLPYLQYQNVYFDKISAYVVYHLQKSYLYLLIFAPIKDFLDVYNEEQPGQM